MRFRLALLLVMLMLLFGAVFSSAAQGTISLLEPAHRATVATTMPSFSWTEISGVSRYVLIVRNRSGAVVHRRSVYPSSCSNGQCSTVALSGMTTSGRYFWQVNAILSNGGKVKSGRQAVRVIAEMREQILFLVNERRCADGRAPLALHDKLNRAVRLHSRDMHTNNYFSHTGQDGSTHTARMRRAGYNGTPMSENIAMGFPSSTAVFTAWWNSSGHRNNMMNSGAREMGIGKSGSYWTMVTGRRGDTVRGTCP